MGRVNLDAFGFDELDALWRGVSDHPRRYALHLFPHPPKHCIKAARLLALYAIESLEARRYRAQGHVADALKVEERCQAIYRQLPEYARW
jgi:hypothetical protein